MLYIHNVIHKILYMMDFRKYYTIHKLHMAHAHDSIIIRYNKFSPNHGQMTLITVPDCICTYAVTVLLIKDCCKTCTSEY